MSLTKKIFFNSIAAIINIAGGLLRNKIFAAYLSVNLFGILSIGQQAMSLLFTLFAFGLPLGITTFSSELVRKTVAEQKEQISRIVVLILMLAAGSLIILGLIIFLDPYYISKIIANRYDYAIPICLILLSAPLMVVENCLFSIMEGMGNLKGIVVFKMIPALVVLPIVFFLVSEYLLIGAAIGMVVNELLLIGVGLFLLRDRIRVSLDSFRVVKVFLPIVRVAILSLLAGIAWMAADFIVKRYLLGLLGESSNAIVQSVAKIVDLYPTIALSWLTMHIFPIVSTTREDKSSVTNSLQRTLVVAVSIVVPIIIILFTFRSLILNILYTSDFIIAHDYFGAMLVTGVLKVYSWVLGVALLPLALKREWFYSVIVQVIAYLAGIYIGISNHIGIYSIPLAHAVSLSAQIVYTLIVFQKNGFAFNTLFLKQSMMFFLLTFLFMISIYESWILIPTSIIFIFYLIRYGLIGEIVQKYYDWREKRIA